MHSTMTRATALISALTIGLAGAARAQVPAPAAHSHTSPHGGEIAEVAEHHVEFKADSTGFISVWLLDEHQRTVAPPSGATVTLMATGRTQVTIPLQVEAAAQRMVARFDPRQFASFQAVVSLSIAGAKRNLRFRYPSHH